MSFYGLGDDNVTGMTQQSLWAAKKGFRSLAKDKLWQNLLVCFID